jgi:hypothetical protein
MREDAGSGSQRFILSLAPSRRGPYTANLLQFDSSNNTIHRPAQINLRSRFKVGNLNMEFRLGAASSRVHHQVVHHFNSNENLRSLRGEVCLVMPLLLLMLDIVP